MRRANRVGAVLAAAGLLAAGVATGASAPPPASAATPAAITVTGTVVGTTPTVLGYNIAHGMAGSNAADWWRYSGVKAARVFISASDIEPTDDLGGYGDGVNSRAGFEARRSALRANAANPAVALDSQYVNWSAFDAAYGTVATGNNRFAVKSWFPQLRALGVDILANITASPGRFPVAAITEYGNLWELWQHYYAQAFMLSRDYGVRRFSMFNEPNGWTPAISVENWALRLRAASDAIQSAVADMNGRYGRSLVPEVLAPNTANGATKYDDYAGGDYWGKQAITERNLDLWGEPAAPGWSNLHVYNYQKYSSTAADYATDYDDLRAKIAADTGGTTPPLALTEHNVRTGANYDTRVETADSPSDFSALGANQVTLAERGAAQLYLFKFGMTERTGGTYPVAKNGTHYVQNATTTLNNYGGAAGTAEVNRLFVKASGQGRDRLGFASTLGAGVSVQVTRTTSPATTYLFLANTATTAATVDVDLAALAVPDGSLVTVEEVSTTSRGGVVRSTTTAGGRVAAASMPAQSVWLISVHAGLGGSTSVAASADASLGDGTGRTTTGGATNPLTVRADGTTKGRRVALLRFPVPTTWAPEQRVLLSLNAATTTGTTPTQAHVYGVEDDAWTEGSVTFASRTSILRQNVGSGTVIANNVVANQGTSTRILGQLMANSTTGSEKLVDVTDFVKAQTDGQASFLLVQDHRWDVKLPERTTGDLQAAGLRIVSRETAVTGPVLRIHSAGSPPPPPPPPPPQPTTINAEFESLPIVATSGDSYGVKSDTAASGGKSILYRATAVNDFITFRLDNVPVGSYAVQLLAKMGSDRAVVQLAVADALAGPYVNVDTPKDQYRSSITFGSVGTFTAKLDAATAGSKFLRLTVTGRNAASSGYYLSADKLTLTS